MNGGEAWSDDEDHDEAMIDEVIRQMVVHEIADAVWALGTRLSLAQRNLEFLSPEQIYAFGRAMEALNQLNETLKMGDTLRDASKLSSLHT